MPVVSALSPLSLSSYFDPTTGAPLAVDLYFYSAGTLDPLPVYVDALLSVPHTIPVQSTGFGRVPPIFIGEIADPGYRVRVFDQYSQLVEDIDNLPGAVDPTGGGGGGGTVEPDDVHLLKTGDYIFCGRNATPREGAVLCNGLTIGSATSPATGRANADAHDLFVFLWGSDEYGLLPVLPTRGASAEGDWLANKSITLPDLQGKTVVGMDAMGVAATGRLAGVPMQSGADLPARIHARGGNALVTLTTAMLPAHAHTIVDPGHTHGFTTPAHSHTFSGGATSTTGAHSHTGTTDSQGAHAHVYNAGSSFTGSGAGPFNTPYSGPPTPFATDTTGAHTHFVATTTNGDHAHTVTGTISTQAAVAGTTASGTTGVTTANTGDATAHNNTPLFVTVSVYMVL